MMAEYDGFVPLLALCHGACRLTTIGMWRAERDNFFPHIQKLYFYALYWVPTEKLVGARVRRLDDIYLYY